MQQKCYCDNHCQGTIKTIWCMFGIWSVMHVNSTRSFSWDNKSRKYFNIYITCWKICHSTINSKSIIIHYILTPENKFQWNFNQITAIVVQFFFSKMWAANWQLFCLGLNILTKIYLRLFSSYHTRSFTVTNVKQNTITHLFEICIKQIWMHC